MTWLDHERPEEDLVLETKDRPRYAPPSSTIDFTEDVEFAKQLSDIPDKLAFRIGEVADLVGVKPYVLRYWESEFEALKPKKSRHNQRMYERRDVETLMLIKKLLYKDRFSIEGARSALKRNKKQAERAKEIQSLAGSVENLRLGLHDLVDEISRIRALFK